MNRSLSLAGSPRSSAAMPFEVIVADSAVGDPLVKLLRQFSGLELFGIRAARSASRFVALEPVEELRAGLTRIREALQ